MERKDFYDYAKKCNKDINSGIDHIEKTRDFRLKSANFKLIEIANYINSNSPIKMEFEICLDKKFYKYDRNWADIFLPYQNIFIFIVDSDEERDLIFQLWKRKNILIFDKNTSLEKVGSEIIRKFEYVKHNNILYNE